MRIPLNFINIGVVLSDHLGGMNPTTPLGRTPSQEGHKVCVVRLLLWESVWYGNQHVLSLVEWDIANDLLIWRSYLFKITDLR